MEPGGLPPVTLVSAPAGFGKTTLLTEWLASYRAPTAWVSLDARDSDPSVFWAYVIAAVARAVPGVGGAASDTLLGAPGAFEQVVTALLNDLVGLDGDLAVVLDDYHVIESIEVQESMRFLVDNLPDRVHVVVAARADPPWPLAALRVRGHLLELRAADLRFTSDETAAYLNDSAGLGLDEADLDALEGRTEGWIAALQLAALSLQGREDPSAFIAGFAGDDRFVVDYLVDEVLDRQPPEIRRFLLDTSILTRLSGALCAAVTGRPDAKATLGRIERSNLFLVELDDRRRWFRYHHLFGDVLRARLGDEDAEHVADLHRRASDWFETEGDLPEAIRHALAAEGFERAADLVEMGLPALRLSRQDATQRVWLDALPRSVLANRPMLLHGLVGAHLVVGDMQGVESLLDEIDGLLEHPPAGGLVVHDRAEFGRLPARNAMHRAGLALLRGDIDATIRHGERAGALAEAGDHMGRGAAAALVGLARWTVGDLDAARSGYEAARAAFVDAEMWADILGVSLGLADMQFALGRLGDAERTLTAGLDVATTHGPLRGTADMHIGLAEVHLERNELDAAAEHLVASNDLGEAMGLGQHAYRWRVVDARLRSIAGDHAAALELLREAEQLEDTDFSPKIRPVAATIARILMASGNLAGAGRWAAVTGLDPGDDAEYLHEYEHLTFARLLVATGRADEAIPLLERLATAAEAGHRTGSAIEAHALLALAHNARGDTIAALRRIETALQQARAERFVRAILDSGPAMIPLLESAIRHDRAAPEATALLASARTRPAPAQPLVDPLTTKELDVLRLLRTELTGPEIAAELIVSINTVRTHTKNIFTKLGVTNRRSAVRRADELGL
jgi:LuxR family maltose regulon positive regulatory protein